MDSLAGPFNAGGDHAAIVEGERAIKDTVVARVVRRVAAPAERVFVAWLEPTSAAIWMRSALQALGLPGDIRRIEIDPIVDGRFTFSDVRLEGEASHWGTSDKDEAEHHSVVMLTLEPDGDGCIATLNHEMEGAWTEFVPQAERGLGHMLEHTERLLAGAEVRWARILELGGDPVPWPSRQSHRPRQ